MTSRTFDRETILDLTVNMIPLGIMLFFIGVFLLLNPFGTDLVATALQMALMLVMVLALTALTYYSGRAISNAEKAMEEHPQEHVESDMADDEIDADVEDAEFDEVTSEEPPQEAAGVAADGESSDQ
jgi:membrane protein implicated in regulation of membrane protease activity